MHAFFLLLSLHVSAPGDEILSLFARDALLAPTVEALVTATQGPLVVDLSPSPGVTLLARLDVRRPAARSQALWRGQLVTDPRVEITLSVHGQTVLADLRSPDGSRVRLRPARAGGHRLDVLPHGEAMPCLTERLTAEPDRMAAATLSTTPTRVTNARTSFGPSSPSGPTSDLPPTPPGGSLGSLDPHQVELVDVLCVYTPQARIAIGGVPAMEALIDQHFDATHMAYADSGILHRLRSVHVSELSYTESGNLLTDLVRLKTPGDGHMDAVHPLRDAVAADLVVLLTNASSAGAGYQMQQLTTTFEDRAFSAISITASSIVFAHETGHNMGLGHNNTPGANSVFCYGFGHETPDAAWRSIMAYGTGIIVPLFSSPLLEVNGQPLGVDGAGCPPGAADAVRTLNETAATVAQFRP